MELLYFAPAVLALVGTARGRNLSLYQFRRLLRLRRSVALGGWLEVYGCLGLALENRAQPPHSRPEAPLRLIGAGALVASSILLSLISLPFKIPFSFAQYSWDLFPLVRPMLAGAVLAASLLLSLYRPKRWLLASDAVSEYPFPSWKKIRTAGAKEEKRR